MAEETTISEAQAALDNTEQQIRDGQISAAINFLIDELRRFYAAWPREQWTSFCQQECLNHPLQAILQQDPLTHYSFSKPRGYSGDAGLLDLIYQHTVPSQNTSE